MHSTSQPISAEQFAAIVEALHVQGSAHEDIEWSESIRPPANPEAFAGEVIFVIANSGMKHTVAVGIFRRVMDKLEAGGSATEAFGHRGKAGAMDFVWTERAALLARFHDAEDKIAFCRSLPWIGGITCFHLAKNFGVDCAKPDVHLQRLADRGAETVDGLCQRLARASGYRIATVDLLLWRACATGLVDSRTGQFHLATRPVTAS
jgi:hypothetical protein